MEEAIHGISGGISGVVALSVWYPLDNLRMRQQAELLNEQRADKEGDKLSQQEKLVKDLNTDHNIIQRAFASITQYLRDKVKSLNFAKNLIKNEGYLSLYSGMSSAMVGIVVSNGVYFYAYKYFKNFLIKYDIDKGVVIDSLITSFLAACCCSIISNPIWVLNSRMSKCKDKTNFDMIKKIINEEGLGSFFKGVIPALILTLNPVIQFVIYEFLRFRLLDVNGNISSLNIILISIFFKIIPVKIFLHQ